MIVNIARIADAEIEQRFSTLLDALVRSENSNLALFVALMLLCLLILSFTVMHLAYTFVTNNNNNNQPRRQKYSKKIPYAKVCLMESKSCLGSDDEEKGNNGYYRV